MVHEFSLKRDGQKELSPNFKVREFACKDGSDKILIDLNLIPYLQCLRDMWGPGNINSAYRHLLYNRGVGSKDSSRHVQGRAVDIRYIRDGRQVPPKEVAQYMEYMGFHGIGEYRTFTHGDTGPRVSRWYNFGKETLKKTHLTTSFNLPISLRGEVTASVLNVREGPSLDHAKINVLPKGTQVEIDLSYKDWGKLHNIPGWVSLNYIKKQDDTELKTGDKVTVNGRGWATSYKTGGRTNQYVNAEMTILAVHKDRPAPYQLALKPEKGWTTGFFELEQIDG